ncbi:phosphatase PAP2 family protein [Paraburkholderia bannensis]|uniref:phosphatase PAP2 family protein n=1 Tax=Paraburkholderia bannensis TaxID=765414 RepID=UPI0004842851|nr:phosphatase PAP2 family protein [Paraburkholderia bannensis]
METIEAFNQAIFLQINATAATPNWLVAAGVFIANYAIGAVPIILACMWLCGGDDRRTTVVHATFVGFVALGINQLIGLLWYHPRPFAISLGYTFLEHAPDSSFPSDHATLLSAISFTLLYDGKRMLGALALAADIAVAWARVFAGVHFPMDMAGAALIAWTTCRLLAPLWRFAGDAFSRALIAVYRKVVAWPISRGWLRP